MAICTAFLDESSTAVILTSIDSSAVMLTSTFRGLFAEAGVSPERIKSARCTFSLATLFSPAGKKEKNKENK